MEQEDRIRLSVRENKIVLAGGMIVIGFSLFILVMGIRYPSAEGNHLVFAAGLFLMMLCGMMMCVAYFHRELTVEDMNIHYVNYIGIGKEFSLDDIGYCKLKLYGNKKEALIESLVLFNLLGDKLCKLEMNMRGARDFLQYLVDNQIKIEYPGAKREKRSVAEPLLWEKAVCRKKSADMRRSSMTKCVLFLWNGRKSISALTPSGNSGFRNMCRMISRRTGICGSGRVRCRRREAMRCRKIISVSVKLI